jgi:VWFA-related protein
MRKLCLLLLFALVAWPALAARQVTVQELEQLVTSLQGKPEAEQAYRIADLELTERLSPVRLANLMSLVPYEKSRKALQSLADRSGFQLPPATELPQKPAPDLAEQKRIMGLAVAYVAKAVPQLPNFFATRSTTRFEDTPLQNNAMGFVAYEPLHSVGSYRVTSLYRDGREVEIPANSKAPKPKADATGLTSWGEFGPVLSTVLLDAARSSLSWSHWEQGANGPMAVFTYSVPREKSHYEVNYCCIAEPGATIPATIPFHELTGYHGQMTVDPATGTILRLMLLSDMRAGAPVQSASLLVEYGPVEIGGRDYICPLRAVSLSQAEKVQLSARYAIPQANTLHPQQWMLNHVVFEDYHLFRAEARIASGILPEEVAEAATPRPASAGEIVAAAEGENRPDAETVTASAAPLTAREIPEVAMEPASELPDAPPVSRLSDDGDAFTMQTVVRLVDIAVTAYDKKGHTATGLGQGDFELLDNGVAQNLRYFTAPEGRQEAAAASIGLLSSTASAGGQVYSNRSQTAPPVASQRTLPIVILLDSANLAWDDLNHARREILRYLTTVPPDQPVGLYVMRQLSFEILIEPTTDRDKLTAVLNKWMPNAQDLANAQAEEQRNRQHFDWVARNADLANVNGNESLSPETNTSNPAVQAEIAASPNDPKLMDMGSDPIRSALLLMTGIARHLTTLAGHKTLVWVSSDNALADWSGTASARQEKGNTYLDPLSMQAREALNEARVSIYPLDASQLETGGISADLRNRNVEVVGKSGRDSSLAGMGDTVPFSKPGRETAAMKQDTRPIAPQIRSMAEATGGRALRRATDIAAELDQIAGDGAATYLIGFSPTAPADDAYHQITIRMTNRKDLTLRYRSGYLYVREPASLRERFRAAVWTPADAGDLGARATVGKDAEGPLIHIVLSAQDLQLDEEKNLRKGKLYVFLVDRDDAALKARVTGQTIALNLKPATYARIRKEGLAFDQKLAEPLQGSSLRIVLVDDATGRMGSITIPTTALAGK